MFLSPQNILFVAYVPPNTFSVGSITQNFTLFTGHYPNFNLVFPYLPSFVRLYKPFLSIKPKLN